ncbi:hypothetical protein ACEWKF_22655 [Escherichia coli]
MNITDKELSSNTVSQYGWNLGEFNHSTPFTSHFIYITDYHKDNTWMISLSIVNPDELMLTPADVVEFNSQVIKVDRQRHPEWFR